MSDEDNSAGSAATNTDRGDISNIFDNDGDEPVSEVNDPSGNGDKDEEDDGNNDEFKGDEQEDDDREDAQDGNNDDFVAGNDDDDDEDDVDVYAIKAHKLSAKKEVTQKKKVRRRQTSPEKVVSGGSLHQSAPSVSHRESVNDDYNETSYDNEDPTQRKRRLLEEKMDLAMKSKGVKRRKADEDDLERMQDDRIDFLKDQMIKAANMDVEKNSQGQIATEKLKLLNTVTDIISRADLAISILDNNLLEAVRLWLEPLPDASMPAYQIQKELINALELLPIKTDHLIASGMGKVLVFYQRSKRTEPMLKKVVDRLIGDWTRPILNKSDSYKDRTIKFNDYNKDKFVNKLASSRKKTTEAKTLYEQNAERRKRAAIPSARTTAYKIAPKVDASLLMRYNRNGDDERFKRINQKITIMSQKKKTTRKSGPSIEGRNLTM
jgi:transcription factor SPN1